MAVQSKTQRPGSKIVSVQVGCPRPLDGGRSAGGQRAAPRSAIYKYPVQGPVWAGPENLDGDQQADRKHHGGADKAILAYSADHYPTWRQQLSLDIPFGGFGENLTVEGLDEQSVCIGDIWQVSSVRLQVSQPRQPCWKLGRRWNNPLLPKQVVETGRGGWYLRVLQPGQLEAGMTVSLVQRSYPQWPISRANDAMYGRLGDRAALVELAGIPELSASWRGDLV